MLAFDLSVAIVTRWAETLSSVSDGPAHGVDSASSGFQTRQDAPVVLAAFVHVAVVVFLALVLRASDCRISGVSAGADAHGSVVGDAAFR